MWWTDDFQKLSLERHLLKLCWYKYSQSWFEGKQSTALWPVFLTADHLHHTIFHWWLNQNCLCLFIIFWRGTRLHYSLIATITQYERLNICSEISLFVIRHVQHISMEFRKVSIIHTNSSTIIQRNWLSCTAIPFVQIWQFSINLKQHARLM